MGALDLTTIIIACIGIVSVVVSGIFSLMKSKRKQENTDDKEKWELINKLINNYNKKQEQMCKNITKVIKALNDFKKEMREDFKELLKNKGKE